VTARRGVSLLETIVALPLLALVLALATALFVAQLRATVAAGARLEASRTLSEVASMLAHDLRGVAAGDLVGWNDSSVIVEVAVVAGVTCGPSSADHLDLVASTGPLALAWRAEPAAGDRVVWAMPDTTVVGGAAVDSVHQTRELRAVARAPHACADSPLRGEVAPLRLAVAPPLPAALAPPPGVLVQVLRPVEWRAYRAGDGETWLGRRERRGPVWSGLQPAAGPLEPVGAGGFVLAVQREDGWRATPARRDAALVLVSLRAPRRGAAPGGPRRADSLRLPIALRGGR
jgi:hypothetical protein